MSGRLSIPDLVSWGFSVFGLWLLSAFPLWAKTAGLLPSSSLEHLRRFTSSSSLIFSLIDLGKQKSMGQTFGLQVLCDGCFTLALASVKKLFTDTKSYQVFVAWPYLVLCTSADPQCCWCGFPFPETFYSQPVTTSILLIPMCHFNGNKYRSISDCAFFPTRCLDSWITFFTCLL